MSRPQCNKCNERPVEIARRDKEKVFYREICWKCRSLQNPNYGEHYKKYHQNLKLSVLEAYGSKCECCQEKEPMFLTIDHINGGGNKHREEVGGGFRMYRWLKKNSFPTGYRILCYNCNCGRSVNGGICPHKTIFPQRLSQTEV
jgi:hypothetical protein